MLYSKELCLAACRSIWPHSRRPIFKIGHRLCSSQVPKIHTVIDNTRGKWLAFAGRGILIIAGYAVYTMSKANETVVETFQRGYVPVKKDTQQSLLIPREKEVTNLINFVENSAGKYVVMFGENGTGKTTLIKEACVKQNETVIQSAVDTSQSDKNTPSATGGCVYVSLPANLLSDVDVGSALASPFIASGFWSSVESTIVHAFTTRTIPRSIPAPQVSLRDALALIEKGAKTYQSHTNKIPVLVIDDVNHLGTARPEDLDLLQKTAKAWANDDIIRVVFVSSDGSAPPRMRGNSEWSRAEVYSVGGISKEDAIKYLEAKKFSNELATRVVRELTGDRLSLIVNISQWPTDSFEVIQRQTFDDIARYANKLIDNPLTQTPTNKIVTALLKSSSKRISYAEFRKCVGTVDPDVFSSLRTTQIFCVTENNVSFQSRAVQTYFELHSSSVS